MNNQVRIIIADDHPVFRRGLRQVIDAEAGFKVIAEAEDGNAALDAIRKEKPDIAIVDVHMPGMGGFDLLRALSSEKVDANVIFLTMYDDEATFNAAIDLGAKGYVLKESAIADITGSIRAVAAGRPYVSAALSEFLLNRHGRASALAKQQPALSALTPTEMRILKMIAEYKTSKEMSEVLHIHYRTVDNHRTNMCQKLGLHGSHALLKFALENKSAL